MSTCIIIVACLPLLRWAISRDEDTLIYHLVPVVLPSLEVVYIRPEGVYLACIGHVFLAHQLYSPISELSSTSGLPIAAQRTGDTPPSPPSFPLLRKLPLHHTTTEGKLTINNSPNSLPSPNHLPSLPSCTSSPNVPYPFANTGTPHPSISTIFIGKSVPLVLA